MAVTTANIIVGAGTLSLGGIDVGATSGGVTMSRTAQYLDVTTDQHKVTLKKYLTSDKRFVKTSLLEATLENLALAWGGVVTTAAGPPATDTLTMGIDDEPATKTISFVGPAPGTYKTRTFTHSLAVNMANSEHSYKKDGETMIPVEFELLADLSATPGEEWGTIVDSE